MQDEKQQAQHKGRMTSHQVQGKLARQMRVRRTEMRVRRTEMRVRRTEMRVRRTEMRVRRTEMRACWWRRRASSFWMSASAKSTSSFMLCCSSGIGTSSPPSVSCVPAPSRTATSAGSSDQQNVLHPPQPMARSKRLNCRYFVVLALRAVCID